MGEKIIKNRNSSSLSGMSFEGIEGGQDNRLGETLIEIGGVRAQAAINAAAQRVDAEAALPIEGHKVSDFNTVAVESTNTFPLRRRITSKIVLATCLCICIAMSSVSAMVVATFYSSENTEGSNSA